MPAEKRRKRSFLPVRRGVPLSFFDRVTKPEFSFKKHTGKQYFPREILQLIDFMARERRRKRERVSARALHTGCGDVK